MTAAEVVAMLRGERMVTEASGNPGLLAWCVTDRTWRHWPAALRRDFGGMPFTDAQLHGGKAREEGPPRDEPDFFARMDDQGGAW